MSDGIVTRAWVWVATVLAREARLIANAPPELGRSVPLWVAGMVQVLACAAVLLP